VEDGTFREDLFYRLSVFTIDLPPLRERPEEIPLLAHHFVQRFAEELDKQIDSVTPAAMALLEAHDWPGNVRELENVIERAVLLSENTVDIQAIRVGVDGAADWDDIPDDAHTLAIRKKELRSAAVDELERMFVLKALRAADGNVSEAARAVRMKRPNLHALMRKHGITAPSDTASDDDTDAGSDVDADFDEDADFDDDDAET
jgi:two-component system response regulator HydG